MLWIAAFVLGVMRKKLVVILGPTGVGKTNVAIDVARRLGTEVVSADSRQVYAGIPIITAAPSADELAVVKHHLVGVLPLDAYYSAALFERDALEIVGKLFVRSDYAVVCGGSMMYIDALCYGIDDIPTISDEVRQRVLRLRESVGVEGLWRRLLELDPEYCEVVDRNNVKRLMHAIEICEQSGLTYTSLREGWRKKHRDFDIIKIGLTAPRDVIFDRINRRVDKMLDLGMVDEASSVYGLRHLNSLNTVGFKEMFRYLDGEWDLPTAVARMQKNTRVYAKKQLTWFNRQEDIRWIDVATSQGVADEIMGLI